jgi:hypothetical protein
VTSMRARRLIALVGCLAIAQAGCGGDISGATSYTCGHMRDTVGAFREQARLIVDRTGLKSSAISTEDGVLDVELLVRHACRGAADGSLPYAQVAGSVPAD